MSQIAESGLDGEFKAPRVIVCAVPNARALASRLDRRTLVRRGEDGLGQFRRFVRYQTKRSAGIGEGGRGIFTAPQSKG